MARCLVRRLTISKSSRSEIGKAGEPEGGRQLHRASANDGVEGDAGR